MVLETWPINMIINRKYVDMRKKKLSTKIILKSLMRKKFIGEFDDDLIVIGLGQIQEDIHNTVNKIIKKYHLLETEYTIISSFDSPELPPWLDIYVHKFKSARSFIIANHQDKGEIIYEADSKSDSNSDRIYV